MKKFVAMLLAVAMVAALLAGCGSGTSTTTGDNATVSKADGADTSMTKSDSTGVIKVGSSGPLTNDYAVYGKAVEYGLKLAFEEINAKGGL